ncbi:unnamed protein product, partial [Meganyctiphanes norvegica]
MQSGPSSPPSTVSMKLLQSPPSLRSPPTAFEEEAPRDKQLHHQDMPCSETNGLLQDPYWVTESFPSPVMGRERTNSRGSPGTPLPRRRVTDDEGYIRRAACVCVNDAETEVG